MVMAELLAVTGGISAMGGIAAAAMKLSKTVYDISKDYKSARKDIRAFAKDIRRFARVIKLADITLDENMTKLEASSRVRRYLEKHSMADTLIKQSKTQIRRIKKILPKLDVGNTVGWVCRIKWHYQKEHVNAVSVCMSGIMGTLSVVLQCVTMAIVVQEGQWDRVVEMRVQLEISRHQLSNAYRRIQELEHKNIEGLEDFKTLEVLCSPSGTIMKLSAHVINIQASAQADARNASISALGTEQGSSEDHPVVPESSNTRSNDNISLSLPTSSSTTNPHSSTGAATSNQAPPRPRTSSIPPANTGTALNSGQQTGAEVRQERLHPEDAHVTTVDHIANYFDNLPHRDDVRPLKVILNGQPISAWVDPKLRYNLVSETAVLRHNCNIQELESEDAEILEFGEGHLVPYFGTVSLKYWENHGCVAASYCVCRYRNSCIVFGAPFLELQVIERRTRAERG